MEPDSGSKQDYGDVTPERASEVIKQLAASNKVELELPPELFERLVESWRNADTSSPAEIRFVVEGREVGNFKIAACAYWSDTCCA